MLSSNACGSGWPPAGIEHRPGEKARDVPVVEASPREDCARLAAERRRRWSGNETVVDANGRAEHRRDRKSTRLNSSHLVISYAVFCLKKKKTSEDDMHGGHS